MAEIRTFCRVCEPACGLVAQVDDGRLAGVKPDRAHPVSRGWACNKGIATFDIHHDPDRLNQPLKRVVGGGFEPISWAQAIGEIGDRLRTIRAKHNDWATSFYIGNPSAFNALIGMGTTPFIRGLAARKLFSSGTQDCSNKFAGSEYVFGSSTIHPLPDFDHTEYLLILGSNPGVSHMSFVSIADPIDVMRRMQERGAKIRFVNPRRIESLKSGIGEWIAIRPDTDVYFLAALLHELDHIGGFDDAVIEEHGRNIAQLREFIAPYTPESVAGVTGIAPEALRQVARDWKAANGASVTMSTGVNMGRQGTVAYWLVQMLSFCTGNLDRRGGNIESVGYYPPAARSGAIDPAHTFFDAAHGRMRHVRGLLPGNLMADELVRGDDRPRALFVVAGNPILSVGGEERLRQAIEGLDLVVCVDLYRNATGELADYLLPATDQFERADLTYAGLGLQYRPHVQYTNRVVEPQGERREEWWIFGKLCQELGFKGPFDEGTTPNIFARLDRMMERGGLNPEEVKDTPGGVMLEPLTPGKFYEDQMPGPDRKVDCAPLLLAPAMATTHEQFSELRAEAPGTFRMISKRDRFMHNSWFHNIEKMKHGERGRNHLFMNPSDAERLGLMEGQLARVRSLSGEVELPIKRDPDLIAGVVAATHGWGNGGTTGMRIANRHPGANVNRLLPLGPGSYDPLSNQAHMTGIVVDVLPVE